MKDQVVESVRQDLLQRSQTGIKKYGVTLDRNDLSLKEWLQHAYEECLDQANYLKRSIMKIEQEENLEFLAKQAQEQGQYDADKAWEDQREAMYNGWLAKEKQKWEKEKEETEAADAKYNAMFREASLRYPETLGNLDQPDVIPY